MPTIIKCIRGSIEKNLSEGNAIFVFELAKYRNALHAIHFNGRPTTKIVVQQLSESHDSNRYLICLDNEYSHSIKTIKEMRKQVFAVLDAFLERGIRTVSMSGIKVNEFPDKRSRPEAYQRQFVEEYIAKYPDAFDSISLVDKYGGFKDPIDGIVDFFISKGWMETEYSWAPPNEEPKSEIETIYDFNRYSSDLRNALDRIDDPASNEIIHQSVSQILYWGRITNGNLVTDYTDAIQEVKRENITDIDSLLRIVGATANQRIASWTKILAAYEPGEFFIYDSRVAIALSFIFWKLGLPCFWQIPPPREKNINIQTATALKRWKNAAYRTLEERCNRTSYKAKHSICYCLYLQLLKKMAENDRIQEAYRSFKNGDIIRQAYENCRFSEEQAIMAHLEKMLFMQKEQIYLELIPKRQN